MIFRLMICLQDVGEDSNILKPKVAKTKSLNASLKQAANTLVEEKPSVSHTINLLLSPELQTGPSDSYFSPFGIKLQNTNRLFQQPHLMIVILYESVSC